MSELRTILKELMLEVREIRLELRQIREEVSSMSETFRGITVEAIDNLPLPPAMRLTEGELPPDFPYRGALNEAGISTFDEVPRTARGLRDVDGIGWDEAVVITRARDKLLPKKE